MISNSETNFDAIVIGAGPAGLSAALYLKRASVNVLLLEKGAPGGKLLNVHEIKNYPGTPAQSGFDLAQALIETARQNDVEATYGDVRLIKKEGQSFSVQTGDADYHSIAVIIATGLSNVTSIKGEKEYLHHGVSYCATCDGPMYRGEIVGVYGSGERVNEEVLYLSRLAHSVHYFSPETSLSGLPESISEISSQKSILIHDNCEIKEIKGLDGRVTSAVISSPKGEEEIPLRAFFPLAGEKAASAFLSVLEPKMNHGFLVVDSSFMTSVEGLFAIGDIVDKPLRQAITAAGDGANVSLSALIYIRKEKKGNGH